jgi:hypothetical protein
MSLQMLWFSDPDGDYDYMVKGEIAWGMMRVKVERIDKDGNIEQVDEHEYPRHKGASNG